MSAKEHENARGEEWQGERLSVAIVAPSGERGAAVVYRHILSGRRRVTRALAALGICWCLGALAVLIPVAHFALVPVLLVAGPIAAWMRYRTTSLVTGGRGACPVCNDEVTIDRQTESWPLFASCAACGARLDADLV